MDWNENSWKYLNHQPQNLQNGKYAIFKSEKLRLKKILFAEIICCGLQFTMLILLSEFSSYRWSHMNRFNRLYRTCNLSVWIPGGIQDRKLYQILYCSISLINVVCVYLMCTEWYLLKLQISNVFPVLYFCTYIWE